MNIHQKRILNSLKKLSGNAIEQETKNFENPYRKPPGIPEGKKTNYRDGGFLIVGKDPLGNKINYSEERDGEWSYVVYDKDNDENCLYMEESNGEWYRWEYDEKGNQIYHEDSRGYAREGDENQKGKWKYRSKLITKLSGALPQDVQNVVDYINKKGITVDKVVKGRNYDGPDFSIYVKGNISSIVSKPTKLFEYTDNWLQGDGNREWYQVFTPEGTNIVFKV